MEVPPIATSDERHLLHAGSGTEQAGLSSAAAGWIELAEQISVCGRLLREGLAGQTGRRQVSQPQFSILWACHQAPAAGVSQNELAAGLAVSSAHISGLVEQLRRDGLLEGRRPASDRRRQFWRLTPTGQAVLESVLADTADWAGRLDRQLGTSGTCLLKRLIDQLARILHGKPDQVSQDIDRKGAA